MSKNHQYAEYADKVFTRYKKTTNGAVSGIRLSPFDNARLTFLLMSNFSKFNVDTKALKFNYDTDVLEVYSAEEDRVFRLLNRYLFENGLIAPYSGDRDALDTANTMSDVEISDLSAAKNILSFKKRLKSITSRATLERLRETVERADRPMSFYRAIEERIKELS